MLNFNRIALACVLFVCTGAYAQDYPNKPINVVVPYPAGGYVDSFARVVTAKIALPLARPCPSSTGPALAERWERNPSPAPRLTVTRSSFQGCPRSQSSRRASPIPASRNCRS